MSATLTVARKELRALFQSPVALVFLGGFLGAVLFAFFGYARFFARNLADVRPLFQWLPLLLIFLVSAVTMRSWAEERKAGTLEVLLTLPVRTLDLVLGKFLAGMALVGIALALTLPLPITVSLLGPLDWGPVIGGYFAALLLASAYMSLGLCVSARTDNQVVALMVTLVLGALLYVVGTDSVTALFGADLAEVLRKLGTGSRFASIERGVLDLRDITYYGSLTAMFLVLNGIFLEVERLDTGSQRGRARLLGLVTLAVLTGANAVAANLWLAPITRVRADLTAGGDYTISDTTAGILSHLDEPVTIRGLFSERTHPKLGPLVPQIRDLLQEYAIAGGDKVVIDVVDPNSDEELEAELNEQYAIRSVPFGVADRHSQSVVNAYFHLLITYGDKFEVLSFNDLIEVQADPDGMDVKLRNLEYDLTRAIKKVSQDFQTVDTLLAKLDEPARITAYITPGSLPEDFQDTAAAMRGVAQDLAEQSGGSLVFAETNPADDPALQQALYEEYGVQPLSADLFGEQTFYLHLLVEVGDNVERILPRSSLTEGDVRTAVEAALRRGVPGQLKKLALLTEVPQPPPPNPNLPPQMQPPAPQPDYQGVQQLLAEQYEVERVDLAEGWVPEDVDVLLIGKAGRLDDRQAFAVDQYLMRGGSVVALAGGRRLSVDQTGIRTVPSDESLLSLIESWGIVVEGSLVGDTRNAPFPQPARRRTAIGVVETIELIPYPFFPEIRGSDLNVDHPVLSGVPSMTMPWSSPVALVSEELEGREVTWLAQTTDEAWVDEEGNIEPDTSLPTEEWFSAPDGVDRATQVLGVAVTGRFPSAFEGRDNPVDGASGQILEGSVADGRLVVLGSSEMVGDLMLTLARQTQNESHVNNLMVVQNAIDWSVEDTDLLSIRTVGAFARTLPSLDDAEARAIEIRTALMMGIPLLLIVLGPRLRRRNSRPLPLTPAEQS